MDSFLYCCGQTEVDVIRVRGGQPGVVRRLITTTTTTQTTQTMVMGRPMDVPGGDSLPG